MKAAIRLLFGISLALGLLGQANTANAGTVRTIGGGPTAGDSDGYNDPTAHPGQPLSLFNTPMGLATDAAGKVYVADFGNNKIRIIDPTPSEELTTTFATLGLGGPGAIAVDSGGFVFVANTTAGNVRRFNPTGGASLVFATGLVAPVAVAIDSSGRVYVALRSGEVRRYASSGTFERSYFVLQGAPSLTGVAIMSDGQIAVSDAGNHVIWRFGVQNGPASLFAGTFGIAGFAEGAQGIGRLNSPQQIATSANGTLVVADRLNHRIRSVDAGGVLKTLYGTSVWTDPNFPGWTDGGSTNAEMREPVGVAVAANGTVFNSEVFYHIVRKATELSFPTNVIGGTNPPTGTVGRNVISLGFEGGEASSAFVGAPGQHFIAPVTLTVDPEQSMYGLQFNLNVTSTTGPNPAGGFFDPLVYNGNGGLVISPFQSFLLEPLGGGFYYRIPPASFTSNRFIFTNVFVETPDGTRTISVRTVFPQWVDLVFPNAANTTLSIGWLERRGQTNLYNTIAHDLIFYSGAHDTLFLRGNGKVIVGGLTINIPTGSFANRYQVQITRPSANGDGVGTDVLIEAPTNSDNNLRISALRPLTLAPVRYFVGDVAPFQWFNAGDFGDGNILNNDLQQLQQTFAYGLNPPPTNSDMYASLDSCCGTFDGAPASLNNINNIAFGDGKLGLEDLIVSFRRSLDEGLDLIVREYTTTGIRAYRTNNLFRRPLAAASSVAGATTKKKPTYNPALASEPSKARFFSKSMSGTPGQLLHVPISVEVSGPISADSVLFTAGVQALNESVKVSEVAFTPNLAFGTPRLSAVSDGGISAAWMESLSLAAGVHQIGTIDFIVPANANADTLYQIKIARGQITSELKQLPATSEDGYIWMFNRAREPWTDGIPDSWRIQYFGSLMDILSAPDADADGDGVTNLDEYRSGTNPRDILSRLSLRGASAESLTSYILSWPTVAGKYYRLESSDVLNGGTWNLVEDRIPGTGGILQRLRAMDAPKARFYRVFIVE